MKKIIIDLDNTLTKEDSLFSYIDKKPKIEVVNKLKIYKSLGFTITIFSARNMKTFEGNIGIINVKTLPEIIEWLEIYLKDFPGALIIISHDRKFLEKVSNKVFWIRSGNIKINNNGYKNFDEWSQNIIDHESREVENLQKKVNLESGWLQTGVTGRRKRNIGRLHHLLELKSKLEAQQKIVFANQNKMKIEVQKLDEDSPQVIMIFNNVSYKIDEENLLISNFNYKILKFCIICLLLLANIK